MSFFSLAQDEKSNKINHKFTRLSIEARADFDFTNYNSQTYLNNNTITTDTVTNNYGFNGKYFNLHFGGEFGEHFSYYFRQRVIAKKGSVSFFDNTDFLYLNYKINDSWSVRFGKDALSIGGYEYDAPPIDVLYYTKYWGNIYCFQLAASVKYTDKQQKNTLTFQFANSPYIYFNGAGNEWQQGLFAYSLMWTGDFGVFKTLYSVNMFERERGKFMGQLALGNKFTFDKCNFYVDYFNKVTSTNNLFADFTLVSRLEVNLKDVNLFVKGGYEQNRAEVNDILDFQQKDILMYPGQTYYFYGLGVEYRPASYKNVRVHAFVANAVTSTESELRTFAIVNNINQKENNLNVNIGVTWNIDFLKYFEKIAKN